VLAQDSEYATVDIGQRGAIEIGTTTPDDTSPVSISRTRRRTQEKTSR
jgi:hypothetical protein